MPDFGPLTSLMTNLHQEFVRIYYLMLPVFFALSIAFTWFRAPQGNIEFVDVLKRAFISTLLLAAFPEISQAIAFVADGIAERIDQVNGLDNFLRMAKEKASGFTFAKNVLLLSVPDLLIALLTFLSYLFLYIARYLTIAMYHFYWIFYMATAPLLLLFNLFPSTSQVTGNLFKGLIEIASWKIVWAILGAMMTALTFAEAYGSVENYITLIVMNFVIAISMLKTPAIVKSLASGGFHGMANEIGVAGTAAMAAVPGKAKMAHKLGKRTMNYASGKIENYKAEKKKQRDRYIY